MADPGERKENTAIAVVYLALARYAADRHDHGAPADLNKLVSNQRVRSVWWGALLEAESQTADHAASWVCRGPQGKHAMR
jgi:hypothetical protein